MIRRLDVKRNSVQIMLIALETQNATTLFVECLKKVRNKFITIKAFVISNNILYLAPCLVDTNCRQDYICHRSQCKDPCSLPNACGVNAQCQSRNHKKICSCPQFFTGNAEVECVRIPSTCGSDLDCPDSMRCHEGICMLICSSNNDCADNERCHGGQCMCKYYYFLFILIKY